MLPYLLLFVVAAFLASSVMKSLPTLHGPSEPYIGKMYAPHIGPTHAGNPRPHFVLYDKEPFLQFNPI